MMEFTLASFGYLSLAVAIGLIIYAWNNRDTRR
jgi:hypothetical protein